MDKYEEEGEGLFEIGSGAFGKASIVRRKKDGLLYCAKKIRNTSNDSKIIEAF